MLGAVDGGRVGVNVGVADGVADGAIVGSVGAAEGAEVGSYDGKNVGMFVTGHPVPLIGIQLTLPCACVVIKHLSVVSAVHT